MISLTGKPARVISLPPPRKARTKKARPLPIATAAVLSCILYAMKHAKRLARPASADEHHGLILTHRQRQRAIRDLEALAGDLILEDRAVRNLHSERDLLGLAVVERDNADLAGAVDSRTLIDIDVILREERITSPSANTALLLLRTEMIF